MFGIPIDDLFTYTNIAYLASLAITLLLTATLWRVSTLSQTAKDLQLEHYKTEANVKIAQANAEAETARLEAAVALAAAAVAEQKAAEARQAAAEADEKAARARVEAAAADARAAEANTKAAEANERALAAGQTAGQASQGLSKLTTLRSISQLQQGAITVAVTNHPGTPYMVALNASAQDTTTLMHSLISALDLAGWQELDWNRTGEAFISHTNHKVGSIHGFGVIIVYFPDTSSKHYRAAKDLERALSHAGLAAWAQAAPRSEGTNQDALLLLIGSKPM